MTRAEAIEVMREKLPWLTEDTKQLVMTLIPELAESEDERIRKDIINLIYWLKGNPSLCSQYYKDRYDGMLAWLEKQKELPLMNGDADLYFDEWNQQQQNPTKRQCFEEGMGYVQRLQKEQPVVANDLDEEIERFFDECIEPHDAKIYGVDERVITVDCYELTARHFAKWAEEHKEQKPVEGDNETEIQKAFREGKSAGRKEVFDHPEEYGLQKEQKPWKVGANAYFTPEQKPAEWSDTKELVFKDICKHLKEEGYGGWVVLLNALHNGEFQQKPADWKPSEQEKGALRTAIHVLTEERNFPKAAAQLQNILDAFEGKESRKDWKPSEEQMLALEDTLSDMPEHYKPKCTLETLLWDLKKL